MLYMTCDGVLHNSEFKGVLFLLIEFQTALHFAAKHGNEDIVKLIAGTHKANVNARTVSEHNLQCMLNDALSLYHIIVFYYFHVSSPNAEWGKCDEYNYESRCP